MQAKEDTAKAEEFELIQIAVINSMVGGTSGKVNVSKLQSKLAGIVEDTSQIIEGETSWTVTGKVGKVKSTYIINENGQVTLEQ